MLLTTATFKLGNSSALAPQSDPSTPAQSLQHEGLVLLLPAPLRSALHLDDADWLQAWTSLVQPSWCRLPPDPHLKDGGHYRHRRHACYVQDFAHGGLLTAAPARAHWQPTDYNALHGGFERWFAPVEPQVAATPAWLTLIGQLGCLFATVRPSTSRWHIEAHQFRIDTKEGIGRPTPEGAHRDGVDFVVVLLVARQGVKGGETRVFQANGPHGLRFVMQEPLTALLLDDARVIHETTTILPSNPHVPSEPANAWRDTLVLTFRAAGFQAP